MIGADFRGYTETGAGEDRAACSRRKAEAVGATGTPGVLGGGRTARISEPPLWQAEVWPVLRTSGVGKPRQVQPPTVTGAPPPLPRICPARTTAAYEFSTRRAVAQETGPLVILIMTGTFTPVRVVPQV
jgi:hypothetical protein